MYEYFVIVGENETLTEHGARCEAMREWSYGRLAGPWGRAGHIFWFNREEDYAMFLLRWA